MVSLILDFLTMDPPKPHAFVEVVLTNGIGDRKRSAENDDSNTSRDRDKRSKNDDNDKSPRDREDRDVTPTQDSYLKSLKNLNITSRESSQERETEPDTSEQKRLDEAISKLKELKARQDRATEYSDYGLERSLESTDRAIDNQLNQLKILKKGQDAQDEAQTLIDKPNLTQQEQERLDELCEFVESSGRQLEHVDFVKKQCQQEQDLHGAGVMTSLNKSKSIMEEVIENIRVEFGLETREEALKAMAMAKHSKEGDCSNAAYEEYEKIFIDSANGIVPKDSVPSSSKLKSKNKSSSKSTKDLSESSSSKPKLKSKSSSKGTKDLAEPSSSKSGSRSKWDSLVPKDSVPSSGKSKSTGKSSSSKSKSTDQPSSSRPESTSQPSSSESESSHIPSYSGKGKKRVYDIDYVIDKPDSSKRNSSIESLEYFPYKLPGYDLSSFNLPSFNLPDYDIDYDLINEYSDCPFCIICIIICIFSLKLLRFINNRLLSSIIVVSLVFIILFLLFTFI